MMKLFSEIMVKDSGSLNHFVALSLSITCLNIGMICNGKHVIQER